MTEPVSPCPTCGLNETRIQEALASCREFARHKQVELEYERRQHTEAVRGYQEEVLTLTRELNRVGYELLIAQSRAEDAAKPYQAEAAAWREWCSETFGVNDPVTAAEIFRRLQLKAKEGMVVAPAEPEQRGISMIPSMRVYFDLHDVWVGVFWKRERPWLTVYVCPLPCLVVRLAWRRHLPDGK